MTWPRDLVTWHAKQPHPSNSIKSCIQLKKRYHPQTYDLGLVLDLHPMSPHQHLDFKAEFLYVREPKGLDYPLTNFFPS